jgi:hypothetical protein
VDADKVIRNELDEVLNEVVSQNGLGGSHFRRLVELGEFGEVVFWREH